MTGSYGNVHSCRPDIVMLDSTSKAAHSVDVAIPNSHSLHSAITEQLRKYADLKEVLIRMWQLKTPCIIPLVLTETGIIQNKSHKNLKLPNLHPALYIS
jgi:hypothetical protein